MLRDCYTTKLGEPRMVPSLLPMTTEHTRHWGGLLEHSADIHQAGWKQTKKNKLEQGQGEEKEKANQNPEKSVFTSMYTKSQGSGGRLPGNRVSVGRQSVWGGVCVCVCLCMCVYTAYVNRLSTERVCRPPRSPKCNWVKFPMETIWGRGPGKSSEALQKACTCALSILGPPHLRKTISSPFSTLLIHSVHVSGWPNVFFPTTPSEMFKNIHTSVTTVAKVATWISLGKCRCNISHSPFTS